MAANLDEEAYYRQMADDICKKEKLPFSSLHVDAPLCWLHEKEVLSSASFLEISLIKEWTKTMVPHITQQIYFTLK